MLVKAYNSLPHTPFLEIGVSGDCSRGTFPAQLSCLRPLALPARGPCLYRHSPPVEGRVPCREAHSLNSLTPDSELDHFELAGVEAFAGRGAVGDGFRAVYGVGVSCSSSITAR